MTLRQVKAGHAFVVGTPSVYEQSMTNAAAAPGFGDDMVAGSRVKDRHGGGCA
jgi:hypothetical protein